MNSNKMKLLIGIQARTHSKRFQGKIYELIDGKSLLERLYVSALEASSQLLKHLKIETEVYILGPKDDPKLLAYCTEHLFKLIQPNCSEEDLIKRYLMAAIEIKATHLIRLTADCPFWAPQMALEIAHELKKKKDYSSNTITRTFVEGLDTQGFSFRALQWIDEHQKNKREHPFVEFDRNEIVREAFLLDHLEYIEIIDPKLKILLKALSVDTQEDLDRARTFYEHQQKPIKRMDGETEEQPGPGPMLSSI